MTAAKFLSTHTLNSDWYYDMFNSSWSFLHLCTPTLTTPNVWVFEIPLSVLYSFEKHHELRNYSIISFDFVQNCTGIFVYVCIHNCALHHTVKCIDSALMFTYYLVFTLSPHHGGIQIALESHLISFLMNFSIWQPYFFGFYFLSFLSHDLSHENS